MLKFRNDRAFSLLELIFAIAVLSVGLLGVVRAFVFSSRMAVISSDILTAVLLSQEKYYALDFAEQKDFLDEVPSSGESREGKFDYRYALSTAEETGLKLWDMKMTWSSGSKEEGVMAATYFLVFS